MGNYNYFCEKEEHYYSSKNIIILPPASDNIDQDSDTENVPDNVNNDSSRFEPAGELEIGDFVNKSSETEREDDLPASS